MLQEVSYSSFGSGASAATGVALARKPAIPAARRVRMWVIYDEGAVSADLNSLLCEKEAEATKWADLLKMRPTGHDVEVIVLDLEPARLAYTLKLLRDELGCKKSAILVNARGNASSQPSGLLPQYRAMVCGWHEVVRLAQNYLRGDVSSSANTRSLF